ncbi:hypothetical protein FKM82_019881, partial [Ascaphus truei]
MCKATGTCILLFYSGLMMGLSSCRSNESATMTISDTSNLELSSTIEPLLNVTGSSKFQSISKQQNPETLSDISTTSHDSETTPVKKVNVTTSIAHLITTLTSTNASTTNTMKNGK